ncbi:MAG: hypothetical protein ATN31_00570 [Candidatus Epulonipiscioides saccharophilum]|nr:MAG: hypothetical protein ATN31_00570 [Epulopiscium sp. AS2M-Bin001]
MNNFINNRRKFLLLVLASSFCGTLYALIAKDNHSLLYTLNNFFANSFNAVPAVDIFRETMITYIVPITLVFIGASSRNWIPLAIVSLFYMVFSYSFTFTCLIILYGLKGVLIAFIFSGITSTVFVGVLIELFYRGTLYIQSEKIRNFRTYFDYYLLSLLVIFGIAVIDAIFIQYVKILVKNVLF